MSALFICFRLLLAGVFMIAGFTKLRDLARTRADFAELGLSLWLIPALSVGLPVVECIVGVLLVWEPTAQWGAVIALGLLLVFTAVLGINLWRGRRPACACFGSLTRARIGVGTLARNVGLMAVAAGLVLLPSSVIAPLPPIERVVSPAMILIPVSIAVCGLGAFGIGWVFQLWRQQGRLLLRLEQLEQRTSLAVKPTLETAQPPQPSDLVGQPLPDLMLRDVTGRRIDLHTSYGQPRLLLFLDVSCHHCRSLLTHLRTWQPAVPTLVLLAEPPERPIELADGLVLITRAVPNAMQTLDLLGTPAALLIDAQGRVAEPVARGAAAVVHMLDRFTRQPQEMQHELAPV